MATKKPQEPVQDLSIPVANSDRSQTIALPEDMAWVGEHLDQFDRSEISIPMLKILQDMSPFVKTRDANYVEGAEPGMLMDSVSKELYDGSEGVVVLPIKFKQSVTEWRPNRGGFLADHGDDISILEECNKVDKVGLVNKAGNVISHSAMYFALLLDAAQEDFTEVVIMMTGYGWKASRNWNSMMARLKVVVGGKRLDNPPVFSGLWRLTSMAEKNDQGDFFRWADPTYVCSAFSHPLTERLMRYSRNFRQRIDAGTAKVDLNAASPD